MPVHLSVQSAGTHVRFETTGEREPVEEMLKVWSRMAEACRELGLDHALLVIGVRGRLTTADAYRIASEVPARLSGAVARLAVVVGEEDLMRKTLFGENVALKLGLDGRAFEDEARALAWLLER